MANGVEGNQTRVHISDELVENNVLFRTFIESSTDGFALYDKDLRYIAINKVVLDRLGLSREQVIGKHILEVRPYLKISERYNSFLKVLETGKSYTQFLPRTCRCCN